jgi:hypothetical protein
MREFDVELDVYTITNKLGAFVYGSGCFYLEVENVVVWVCVVQQE